MIQAISSSPPKAIIVIGRESVGKSQLVSQLTGRFATEANFRGSTVAVQCYPTPEWEFVDTPGILRTSDTDTTRRALTALLEHDVVLLVAQAIQLDDDLAELLPLVVGKQGLVAVTYWDKIQQGEAAQEALEKLSRDLGVPFISLDARLLPPERRDLLQSALANPGTFQKGVPTIRTGWRIEPVPGWLEHRWFGPILAVLLLLLPVLATVFGANRLADLIHPPVAAAVQPVIEWVNLHAPSWLRLILTTEQGGFGYGLLNMGPFLLVWALPTVLLFSLILGIYKSSGLVERINVTLHPYVRPFGLSGRDVVRIMMGLGCNVPAVVSTRACSSCSRGTAVSAIAFGAACSYQLPATLAVLSVVATTNGTSPTKLSLLFLGYLLTTTLIYLRLTAPAAARTSLNLLLTARRPFMQWPTFRGLWQEARDTLSQFVWQALPIFAGICIVASLLSRLRVLDELAQGLSPLMKIFNLPSEAALAVVLASVRKDGIFLLASEGGAAVPMTALQALTAVYLAGVLLPCLVTALTIGKEISWSVTGKLLLRQAAFAVGFSILLAWGGMWFLR
ncbi:MAG TPA: nucleoside recognition domain-containing protein [Planctomicrobium sp.]|nr:nucleoside recognition domain-containing protein [Planctomicrobium sp.]